MQAHSVDHLFFLLLLLATPVWARWGYRRLVHRVQTGFVDPRISEYRSTLRVQWGFIALLLGWWALQERSWALLGFGHRPVAPAWIGWAMALAVVVFLLVQYRLVTRSGDRMEELESQLEDLRALLPHDEREGRWFRAVSFTAGTCEEIAFRGFLIAYLQPALGLGGALAASSLMFGLGHLYQGPKGVAKTAVVGLLLGAIYLLSGSLWAPMLVHVVVDWNAGALALRVLTRPTGSAAPQQPGV